MRVQTHYNVHIGTLKWHREDDQGTVHKFLTPKSYYLPERGVRISSPQHWDQVQNCYKPNPSTMEITNHQSRTLHWKQGKFKRTVMLSKHNNVATFWLAPGFRKFEAYEATVGSNEATDSHPFIADQVHIREEDETP